MSDDREREVRLSAWLDDVQVSGRVGFPTYANPGELKADLQALLDVLAVCRARNETLAAGVEEYLLWEPGKRGHADAHRKLAALASGAEPGEETTT